VSSPWRRHSVPFERIVVAVDGSDASFHAFEKALELAGLADAMLLALAVEGPLPAYAATIGEIEEVRREKDQFFASLAERVRARADAAGVPIEVELRPGHAADLIVRYATEVSADLIVLGHKGHFVRDHLLGSTADRVAESAGCPVMIVR
jgi:nucleotide-binding universal stress UspA family protein